jgi:hypothetical protein
MGKDFDVDVVKWKETLIPNNEVEVPNYIVEFLSS